MDIINKIMNFLVIAAMVAGVGFYVKENFADAELWLIAQGSGPVFVYAMLTVVILWIANELRKSI